MSKRLKYWLIGGFFAVIILFGVFVGGFFTGRNYYLSKDAQSINFILETYKKYYYFEEDVDLAHLVADKIMDEYSQYYSKEELELIEKASQGYRNSLGLGFIGESLNIEKVLYNSPAERSGIKENGIILKINEQSVDTYSQFKEVAKSISDKFSLTIKYGEQIVVYENLQQEEFKETYVKFYDGVNEYSFGGENITLKTKVMSAVDGEKIPNNTLYLKYSSFNGIASGNAEKWLNNINTSLGQFKIAMDFFKSNNKTKIILDLRGNGGGYVSLLKAIVPYFISSGTTDKPLIYYSKDKNGNITENYCSLSSSKKQFYFQDIIILADNNSASASESFIGAVLDYDSPNIVKVVLDYKNGKYSTYGKGIVQDTHINKITGEGVKLTVAELFWPISNVSIHQKGINKNLGIYTNKIHESKIGEESVDALKYAVMLLNS